MDKHITVWLFAAIVIIATLVPDARAQAVAVTEVDGYITDPSGKTIAGALVSVTETDKQQAHRTTTDAQGRYQFPNLPVGVYQLEVSAPGFKVYVQSGIVLQVATNIEANAKLELGSVSESIHVTATGLMVETKDSSVAEVVDQQKMVELPLNGRNPTQLLTLTEATNTAPTGSLVGSKSMGGSNASGTFTVAGGQANGTNYLLDGGDNNDPIWNVNLPIPFPDAIEEFSVQTSALSAQYGLHPGGIVNVVTRSGSNNFHGDVFEFLRNGDFDARQAGTPARDTLKQSQFGGVIGGRVIRNKLFFFGGFQGTRQRSNPPSTISYVPTATVLNGNFNLFETPRSAGGCLSGSSFRQLKDPTTGAPYPNDQIPVSEFNPAALALATKYLPTSSNPCGEVQYGLPANNPDNQWIGRVDYVRNEKHSLYGRYYVYDYTAETTFNGSNLLTTTASGNRERSETVTFGDNYAFNPTTLNSFHATFDRRRDDRGAAPNDINPATLGVNVFAPLANFLYASVSNYFSAGCGTCAPAVYNAETYQLSDDVNLIRGKHQLGFGVDARRAQVSWETNNVTNGEFVFNGSITGDALADFLLGRMSQFVQGNPAVATLVQTIPALYAQDTFHVTPRLTLNFGIRWEPSLFPYDTHNRADQFSLAAFEAGTRSTVYPQAPPGLVFNGDAGDPYGSRFTQSHWLTSSPRAGIVWDPTGSGKQTIRMGFALMHDAEPVSTPADVSQNPPFGSNVTLTPPTGTFSNPWAGYPGGNPFPSGAVFPVGGTYDYIPQNLRPTYMSQWNISYQRQIGSNWLASVSYLGNESTHLWAVQEANPSIYIPGSTAAANQRRILYLLNPTEGQYYGPIFYYDDGADSKYDAMVLSVQHRFARHYTILSNYTYSHSIGVFDYGDTISANANFESPYNRSLDRGSSDFDHRHSFITSLVATSPVIGHSFTGQVLRDWQAAAIYSMISGAPINITDGGLNIPKRVS